MHVVLTFGWKAIHTIFIAVKFQSLQSLTSTANGETEVTGENRCHIFIRIHQKGNRSWCESHIIATQQ